MNEHFFLKVKDEKLIRCEQSEADYVRLPIAEYNGLQNALRIVRDRAIQQIDKSKADKHGYTLLRADLRRYERSNDKAWLITKSTPYSCKIGIQEAKDMISSDLSTFYNYVKSGYYDDATGYYFGFTAKDMIEAKTQYDLPDYPHEFYISNNAKGKALYNILHENAGIITFEISKLSINYAVGTYEVSYWATDLI